MATLPGACAREGGLSGPALIFLLAALGLFGCGSGIQKTVRAPKEPLQLTSAFVYPFGFRWEEPVYRRFELTQRLIGSAIHQAGDRLAFFGPSEFKVLKEADDGAWVATTALPLLLASAQRPDQGVIIRPWAEKRTNTQMKESYDKKGKSAGMASMEETIFLGHIEVVHPSSGQVLVEVSGQVKHDPFSAESQPEDEFDPARPLTVLMAKLMREAVEALRPFSAERKVAREFDFTVALTPQATLRYQEDNKPPAEVQVSALDPIAAELFLQNRARYLAPFLAETEVPRVTRMPVGLYVAAAPAGAKVEPGDLLVSIDGDPALPQRLARLRFAEVPAQVLVRKPSGQETEVLLP